MKNTMPLPVSVTDYILLDQMGYSVVHQGGRPVKVVPKGRENKIVCSAEEVIRDLKLAFKKLIKKLDAKLPDRSEHNAR